MKGIRRFLKRYWWLFLIFLLFLTFPRTFLRVLPAGVWFALQLIMNILMFAFLFLYLASRTRIECYLPGDLELSWNDYRGQPELVKKAELWVRLLRGVEEFEALGGRHITGILLTGKPGTGKSFLAGSIVRNEENSILLDLEGSARYIDCSKKRIKNYASYQRFVRDGRRWNVLAVDTIDKLSLWLQRDILESNPGYKSVFGMPHGKGLNELYLRFCDELDVLRNKCEILIICAHSKTSEDGKSLLLTKNLTGYLQGESDYVGYCWKRKEEGKMIYMVDFAGDDAIEAKSRNPLFASISSLPNTWEAIVSIFEKEEKERKAREYEKMLKWLEKAFSEPALFIKFLEEEKSLMHWEDQLDLGKELLKSKEELEKLKKEFEAYKTRKEESHGG